MSATQSDSLADFDKDIVADFNQFLLKSLEFFNTFVSVCESKLDLHNHRIHRLESAMKILESELGMCSKNNRHFYKRKKFWKRVFFKFII